MKANGVAGVLLLEATTRGGTIDPLPVNFLFLGGGRRGVTTLGSSGIGETLGGQLPMVFSPSTGAVRCVFNKFIVPIGR